MAVKLSKGQAVNLRKDGSAQLKTILVGLGWDPIKKRDFFGRSAKDMDIDASVISIDGSGRNLEVVAYYHTTGQRGAILHGGDNLTGEGDGDDEQIIIKLDKLPETVQRLSVIINIFEAFERGQDFGDVRNCFVHVDEAEEVRGNFVTKSKLVHYDVDGNFDKKTGIFVADIYRYKGEWKFKALGEGVVVQNIAEMVKMKCNGR